jgi:hypothetical protein
MTVIVVVEGPSAAGKTTWCSQHAGQWLPEPGGRWPMEEVLRYHLDRWHRAVDADANGEVIVLDGDPFKLYYSWASWRIGQTPEEAWREAVDKTRLNFVAGDLGLADLVLYSDPGEDELRRRKEADRTRTRRNFDLHTAMRPHCRAWYEAVAALDARRVVWHHPSDGLPEDLLAVGPRPARSGTDLFDRVLAGLESQT